MPSPVPSFARFLSDSRGSVVAAFGLLVPLLAGAALFAIDHVEVSNRNAELQRAADITALGTVRSLRFTGTSGGAGGSADDGLTAIATSIARNSIDVIGDGLIVKATRTGSDGVRVSLTTRYSTILGGFSGLRDLEVTAEAEAELFGARNICVIAFEEDQQVGINLEDSARIEAGDCGLYSNSQAVSSVIANDSAYIKSEFVCAVGGYTGPDGNYSSKVTTDCPPIEDPLAARAVPEAPAHCDHNYLVLTSGAHTLEPGHYCGGLIVGGTAEVQMNPGVYILSDGPMIVQNEAILSGERVGIVMDDARGDIIFEHDADISLSAPTDGDLAGIVIASRKVCTEKANCHHRVFNITSAHVRSLLGTIYVPEDRFIIDTTMPISGEAAFTIILSRFMQGQQAPTLVLNTNYDATDVPVPDGFIGAKGSRLVR